MVYNEELMIRALSTEIRMGLVSKGWNQQDLAEMVGITRESMSRYLSGKKSMPMPTFFRVADAFGVSPRELMYRAELRVEEEGSTV